MKRVLNQDIYMGASLLIVAFIFFVMANNLISEAALFPIFLLVLLSIFSIFIIFKGMNRAEDSFGDHGDDEQKLNLELLKSPLMVFVGIVIYSLLITLIGFFIATSLFLIVYLYLNHYRSIVKITLTVVIVNLFIFLVFVQQLNVRLPLGILFE